VENDSPDAIAVGFVVEGARVSVDENGAYAGGVPVLLPVRRAGAVDPEHGLVFPVPHRTKVRIALTNAPVDVAGLADVETVYRAWDRILDRGLRTELPQPLQGEVDAARADLLLAPASAETFGALEAWGFDEDAIDMWGRLNMRARRAARRAAVGLPTDVLGRTRAALVEERGTTIDVLPGFRAAWLGQHLAVHDLPLRRGTCSFAVRWHGARPALLWDVPAGTTLRAPTLDAEWSTDEAVGETLLGEPPAPLLAMGSAAEVAGTTVEAPEQFT
jgi:hypothetical protein